MFKGLKGIYKIKIYVFNAEKYGEATEIRTLFVSPETKNKNTLNGLLME